MNDPDDETALFARLEAEVEADKHNPTHWQQRSLELGRSCTREDLRLIRSLIGEKLIYEYSPSPLVRASAAIIVAENASDPDHPFWKEFVQIFPEDGIG